MTEEELKQLQEQLEAQKAEQEKKARELEEKEQSLNEKETKMASDEADAGKLAETIKATFEKRLTEQKETYEKRLKERDSIIMQLASGKPKPQPSAFQKLNERRENQRKANYAMLK